MPVEANLPDRDELTVPLDFARALGVSHGEIYAAIETGRITAYDRDGNRLRPGKDNRGKFVRLTEAKRQWERNRMKEPPGETDGEE